MNRPYPAFVVSKKGEKFLSGGHIWVYENELLNAPACADGEIADVYSEKGRYLGSGFYNRHSKIRIRILSKNANDRFEDGRFFLRRISYALEYRRTVMPGEDFRCCRLIFGEADGLPGLTVDRYGDILVAQCLSLGMDRRKERIYNGIVAKLREMGEKVLALYERNDVAIRRLEGMEEYTGFFLDQKYNRRAVGRIAKDKTVLDCFTHTGSFALNAAKGGAKRVTAVDISSAAIELAKKNALENDLTNLDFLVADVFDLLTDLQKSGKSPYDFIILDPPAFTKSGTTVKNAYRGYKEINLKAMRLLPRGGYLATCSCSHFMPAPLFEQMLDEASADAGVQLRQIEMRQQAPDHPILRKVPETDYLKFYLFQVV